MKPRFSLLVLFAISAAGCDTLSQDFADLQSAITPKTPSEAARDMVDPYDSDKRREGTTLIANAPFGGGPEYVSLYRDMVRNERDPIVLAVAVRALARHGTPEDALLIIPHLAHETVQVRWEAAKGLQRLHNPDAVVDLLKALRAEAEQPDVRVAAATALGQYAEDRVFQGLVAALDARELAINVAAEKSLQTLTGQDLGLDGPAWIDWYDDAAAQNTAFAQQREYHYPTYMRDETFLEKIAFWTTLNFEQPAPPAGLRPKDEGATYEDDDTARPPDASGG